MNLNRKQVMREVRRASELYGITWRQWRRALDSEGYVATSVTVPCRIRGCWHTLAALWSKS
ncbi:MAG TPA: hypothetical protein DCQ64_01255 [Candidatus Rokubacteria bacterium]|nr:hypothetical protein [Candidatus Rokubacteria bacterium]